MMNHLLHHHLTSPSSKIIDGTIVQINIQISVITKTVRPISISSLDAMKVSISRNIYQIIIISIYLVSASFAERLQKLKGYEIVFICDDSGSMNTPLGES
jgi:hypothetical protein